VSPATSGREDGEIEAIIVDRYLESLLARRPVESIAIDPVVADAARRLGRDLPRFHPSFIFEERLAHRLAMVAAGADAVVLPFTRRPSGAAPDADRNVPPRQIVIGGVLTSAALSLAGAAYVAWRLSRPATPMSRAVRAVARGRIS
jgi:hypothetical protein